MLNKKFSHLLSSSMVALGGRQAGVQYLISSLAQQAPKLQKWILSRHFLDHENPDCRMQDKRGRERNKLYKISIEAEIAPLIMKVSEISPNYKWWRRMELYIQHWFKDYNLNAFQACNMLHGDIAGVVKPIAWWSYYPRFAHRKSYFLYRAVQIDGSVSELYEKLKHGSEAQPRLNRLAEKWVALVAAVHKAAWRHGDPAPNNVGVKFQNRPGDIGSATEADVKNSQLHLFDYDKCQPARLNKPRWLKLFFDLNCLRNVDMPGLSHSAIVRLYLQQSRQSISPWEERLAIWAASFWKAGGFSPPKRLRRFRKYEIGRHLRKKQINKPTA